MNDVSWSPCGTRLASCSTDGSVMIWDITEHGLGPVLTSSGSLVTRPYVHLPAAHEGWVRGIAWDPVGKVAHTHMYRCLIVCLS